MGGGGGGRGGEEGVDGAGGVGCHAGYETHVLSQEAFEVVLVDVAIVVLFAGWFPEDAVREEFGGGC